MGRGIPSPAPASLPRPSFVKVHEDASTQPAGIHDAQARTFGYNDFSEFKRPEHYIRHIEPLDSELAVQVEYDMDEQDQEWLDAVNTDRKKEQLDKVTYEVFEVVMDRLEKEWFDLTKNIPKPDMALPSEDSTCAICDDAEGENSNAIVFCDGCNLAVHQDCYGVPYIPEGQWLCRKCTVSPENPVSCILCPNEGGAFKQTVHGDWVHLLCAIWVPETRVVNDVFMEPITDVDKVPKQRWKLRCSICDIREGACIQCNKASCFLAFHPTCARKEKLMMPMKSQHGAEITLTCYCEKHLPKEQSDARRAALSVECDDEGGNKRSDLKANKSARAYAKTYKLGAPLVPSIIVDRIMQYIGKVNIRKKMDFLLMVCKYWSLKREARRGAPLLKRLHLEPWTASAGGKQQTDEEKGIKLEHLHRLRKDLETVRMLAELCRKRESKKLQQAETIQHVLSHCLFTHEPPLRLAFERIMGFDRNDYFRNPVSRQEVPDYFDIIERPISWSVIDGKLDRHEYWDVGVFKADVTLVLDNAMVYNKHDTAYYKAAARIKLNAQPILDELDRLAGTHANPVGTETSTSSVGDLEPPVNLVNLLVSEDTIKDEVDFILDAEPIVSLFSYELEQPKPPPPLPPTPPPPKSKQRKGTKTQRRKAKEIADALPGFRAPPRTRRAPAEMAASETDVDKDRRGEKVNDVANSAASGKRGERKKPVSRLPGQAEEPPLVSEVDNRQSFKMFDAGWILPPDQKRGGRVSLDRSSIVSPPKKKQKSKPKSRLTHNQSSAAENETVQDAATAQDERMDVDTPALQEQAQIPADVPSPLSAASDEESSSEEETGTLRQEADGTYVIEFIDTPATRRAKAMRKKAKRERRERARRVAELSSLEPEPSSIPIDEARDDELSSQLTELTDIPDEDEVTDQETEQEPTTEADEAVSPKSVPSSKRRSPSPVEERGVITLPKDEMLEGGTLVWAKAPTFPWWPAVIWEDDDENVPDFLEDHKEEAERIAEREADYIGPLQLVQFYDKRSSWQWIPLNRLRMMGEDDTLDQEMLERQKFRNKGMKNELRESYRRAIKEMEINSAENAAAAAAGQITS